MKVKKEQKETEFEPIELVITIEDDRELQFFLELFQLQKTIPGKLEQIAFGGFNCEYSRKKLIKLDEVLTK